MTAEEDLRPAWAVELITQVAILNEKIPNHIEWVERNVKDHETRIRSVETQKADKATVERLAEKVDRLEANADRSAWAGRVGWLLVGAVVASVATIAVTQLLNL